jgi:uncharacterized protein YcsI (UPF0317 family)
VISNVCTKKCGVLPGQDETESGKLVEIAAEQVPVFRVRGVTPQAMAEISAVLPLVITPSRGHSVHNANRLAAEYKV